MLKGLPAWTRERRPTCPERWRERGPVPAEVGERAQPERGDQRRDSRQRHRDRCAHRAAGGGACDTATPLPRWRIGATRAELPSRWDTARPRRGTGARDGLTVVAYQSANCRSSRTAASVPSAIIRSSVRNPCSCVRYRTFDRACPTIERAPTTAPRVSGTGKPRDTSNTCLIIGPIPDRFAPHE